MKSKKVAISQSNYIPWKGYFENIKAVDEFVLYDDMQYTKRDWRNRNKIKTQEGLKWLTIPVIVKGNYYQKINETKISDHNWKRKHLATLRNVYSKAKCYGEVIEIVEMIYETANQDTISELNYHFLTKICEFLKIDTKISFSSNYKLLENGKTERLVDLCKQLQATDYFSGPAAKNYMDVSLFENEGIKVHYYDYSNYPEYTQLYGKFEHRVSILDLIFNEGTNASNFISKE